MTNDTTDDALRRAATRCARRGGATLAMAAPWPFDVHTMDHLLAVLRAPHAWRSDTLLCRRLHRRRLVACNRLGEGFAELRVAHASLSPCRCARKLLASKLLLVLCKIRQCLALNADGNGGIAFCEGALRVA